MGTVQKACASSFESRKFLLWNKIIWQLILIDPATTVRRGFGRCSAILRECIEIASGLSRDNFGTRSAVLRLLFALLLVNNRRVTEQLSNKGRSIPEAVSQLSRSGCLADSNTVGT
ncbi:hypothetical protein KUH03_13195 [Sphingobacterium sp. E70]|uniref:hypothetical protein n=1 Tax=Sphingobacterium sp. E70 TaxID=2853439 RepID=UPI00211B9920|nr:hypothetical protein [Sphingobacterium sp. E70]ULT27571.1 hypothetical protein KUH03_13195 [Sphingobacterium sp. E70]